MRMSAGRAATWQRARGHTRAGDEHVGLAKAPAARLRASAATIAWRVSIVGACRTLDSARLAIEFCIVSNDWLLY